jgi:Uncharacterized conserved protein
MSDADMMRFMAGCMLAEGPAPSVETPLHSLLPHRVIAHTHDVATMSLTNVPDATAQRLVQELFEGAVTYVPYSRPGFPLARAVSAWSHYPGRRNWADPRSPWPGRLGGGCGAVTRTAGAGGRQDRGVHRRLPPRPAAGHPSGRVIRDRRAGIFEC